MEDPLDYAAAVASHHHDMDTSNSSAHNRAAGAASVSSHQAATKSAYERLLHPKPKELILVAALQLLQPFQLGDTVYLLPIDYVQNWLYWAFHQNFSSTDEKDRAREALKHAAFQLHLIPPTEESDYQDPGPIDAATSLAVQGHPMVLQPTVRLHRGHGIGDDYSTFSQHSSLSHHLLKPPPTSYSTKSNGSSSLNKAIPMKRNSSSPRMKLPPSPSSTKNAVGRFANMGTNGKYPEARNPMSSSMNKANSLGTPNGGNPSNPRPPECLAVPEAFYVTLRSVHGVICKDGYTVSFQQHVSMDQQERILLHHEVHKSNGEKRVDHTAGNPQSSFYAMNETSITNSDAIPVEFRRKIIAAPASDAHSRIAHHHVGRMSLMDKLLIEEERRHRPRVPVPEIHPIKLTYRLQTKAEQTDAEQNNNKSATSRLTDGFVLVSQEASAVDALSALVRVAAPTAASNMVRLWSRYRYPWQGTLRNNEDQSTDTQDVMSFELIDFALMTEHDSKASKPLSVGEWAQQHTETGVDRQIECLVEVRPTVDSSWPRESLELMKRIRVGDFCDAQDVAGKWYEAVVCKIEEESVTVHYFGWASRWNATLKRTPKSTVEGMANKLLPPAPLWSHTPRWRERIQVGDIVEVRDTSSLVHRPKWYKGEVKKIGRPSDPMRELEGGADLELYPVKRASGGGGGEDTDDEEQSQIKQEPLLLLKRGQQILVEVAQEKTEKAGAVLFTKNTRIPQNDDLSSLESLLPEPPFLRWVDLYGEEICKLGTHLKLDDEMKSPSILKYELEYGRKPVEIMKSHPSLGGAGFMRESLRGAPPAPGSVGLHNLGNSCFLNSTVQCLNHMEVITQYFMRDAYISDLNRQNPLGSGGNVAMAYGSLIKKMWSGEYSVLAPRSLKQTVAAFAPQFDNSYQHDSQEFCQFLMDGLHEDLNRVKQKPYVEELEGFGMEDRQAAVESWKKHLLRHDSIFVDHCQGMHRSHLTCPQCGRESIKFDVYSSISLPLASKKDHATIQLEDCIEMFMEGEQLDERNAWYCPSCRRHVCALKLIALWSAPDILILHLKRFQFDTCMTSGGMLRSKIDDTVDFPIEGLDLTRFILGPIDKDAPPIYKLFGVSEHTGPTANSGHYTATVRNSIDGQWYRCNDSHVGRTSGEAAITGGAYLLFYQRLKGTTRWAGMERVMMEYQVNHYGVLEVDQDGFKRVKTRKKKKGGR
ncbi:hypothetical protein ACA910_005782 [Epithemia clementina (nom. ined.)]